MPDRLNTASQKVKFDNHNDKRKTIQITADLPIESDISKKVTYLRNPLCPSPLLYTEVISG